MPDWIFPEDEDVEVGLRVIAERIRRGRDRLGVAQSVLGEWAGMSQSTISKLENAKLDGLALRRLARLEAILAGLVPPERLGLRRRHRRSVMVPDYDLIRMQQNRRPPSPRPMRRRQPRRPRV